MKLPRESLIKEVAIFFFIFLGLFTCAAVLQDVSAKAGLSFPPANLDIPSLTLGGTVVFTLIGVFVFYYFSQGTRKKGWEILLSISTIVLGLGGIAYAFLPTSAALVGLAAPGVFLFILPSTNSEWEEKYFALPGHKRYIVAVAVGSFAALYSAFTITGMTLAVAPVFAGILFGLGIAWTIWVFLGQKFNFPFMKTSEVPAPAPVTLDSDAPKYLVTLFIIIGWNFTFLLLVEFWNQYLLEPNANHPFTDTATVGLSVSSIIIGVGLMLIIQWAFLKSRTRSFAITLVCLVGLFVVMDIENFMDIDVTSEYLSTFLGLVFLPSIVAGVFQCIPFAVQNPGIKVLRTVLIIIDVGVFTLQNQVISQLTMPQDFHNTMMPTVFLLNAILLGIMFILNYIYNSVGNVGGSELEETLEMDISSDDALLGVD